MWPLGKIHKVGELVAAAAVVISLVFVGYEVKQNSQAQTRMATEAVVRDFVGTIRSLNADADMACIYSVGVQDFESLSGSERLKLSAYLMGVFYAIQDMHNLQKQDEIDPGIWRGFEQLSHEILQLPGIVQWFATRRHFFSENFQTYVDSIASNQSSVKPVVYDDPACQRRN